MGQGSGPISFLLATPSPFFSVPCPKRIVLPQPIPATKSSAGHASMFWGGIGWGGIRSHCWAFCDLQPLCYLVTSPLKEDL